MLVVNVAHALRTDIWTLAEALCRRDSAPTPHPEPRTTLKLITNLCCHDIASDIEMANQRIPGCRTAVDRDAADIMDVAVSEVDAPGVSEPVTGAEGKIDANPIGDRSLDVRGGNRRLIVSRAPGSSVLTLLPVNAVGAPPAIRKARAPAGTSKDCVADPNSWLIRLR
jgi:hypothetical protein